MQAIYRHVISTDGDAYEVECNGEIIHVAIPGNRASEIEFWEMRNLKEPLQTRLFGVVATGVVIPNHAQYLGTTARVQSLVWHLFEYNIEMENQVR